MSTVPMREEPDFVKTTDSPLKGSQPAWTLIEQKYKVTVAVLLASPVKGMEMETSWEKSAEVKEMAPTPIEREDEEELLDSNDLINIWLQEDRISIEANNVRSFNKSAIF